MIYLFLFVLFCLFVCSLLLFLWLVLGRLHTDFLQTCDIRTNSLLTVSNSCITNFYKHSFWRICDIIIVLTNPLIYSPTYIPSAGRVEVTRLTRTEKRRSENRTLQSAVTVRLYHREFASGRSHSVCARDRSRVTLHSAGIRINR